MREKEGREGRGGEDDACESSAADLALFQTGAILSSLGHHVVALTRR